MFWKATRPFSCLFLVVAGALWAAPAADPYPKTWQLEFSFYDPQKISVRVPGESREMTCWYLLYRVSNHTGGEIQFYPSFRLVTDTLREVEGGAEVNPIVYDAIFARHKREFPFLSLPGAVTGLLLQGEENSRSSVAVFREFDPEASSFTILVSGLSGDLVRIPSPAFNPKEPESSVNQRSFLLRRTLAIRYDVPGDVNTTPHAVPVRRSREWVMQ
jgi:hypothetical protein